jgi:predicted lipid-binding transport protein (Tim44 family)
LTNIDAELEEFSMEIRGAPRGAAPMERSITSPTTLISAAPRLIPRVAFFRRFWPGPSGSFIGAGLFGLLFRHGLFGGLGGGLSILGLLLQIGLLFLLFKFVMGLVRISKTPSTATSRRTTKHPSPSNGLPQLPPSSKSSIKSMNLPNESVHGSA